MDYRKRLCNLTLNSSKQSCERKAKLSSEHFFRDPAHSKIIPNRADAAEKRVRGSIEAGRDVESKSIALNSLNSRIALGRSHSPESRIQERRKSEQSKKPRSNCCLQS
jgi:hypothetical protein